MADTLYTRALIRAAEIHGSTQALASQLRVPENTLLRWMAGRAQMPLAAFLRVIEVISEDERKHAPERQSVPASQKLQFKWTTIEAHCAHCDGVDFLQADPGLPLRYVSELVCCQCGQRVIHGDLISQLAKDAVYYSKATAIARQKRQAQLLSRKTEKKEG